VGAARRVAAARGAGTLSAAYRIALDAFNRFMLHRGQALDLDALPDPRPTELADAVRARRRQAAGASTFFEIGGCGSRASPGSTTNTCSSDHHGPATPAAGAGSFSCFT
jgi:hypothetical protein